MTLKNRILNLEKTAPQPDNGPDEIQIVGVLPDGSHTEPVTIYKKPKKREMQK